MDNEVIVTDATIIQRVSPDRPAGRAGMGASEMLMWVVISVVWFVLLRFLVVGAFALPWLLTSPTPSAAQFWMVIGTPMAVAVAAFVTLQTNMRNRELHAVLTAVVVISAVLFHINLSLGNPSMASLASTGTGVVAWLMQALGVIAGALAGQANVKRRRARAAARQPALPVTGH
jgi:hypothetical protein